ncbi:MAG: hypothetical protein K8R87_10990 [Verrucomicrobia bacterium]|nr:hypothetical protein [Verrucomicrobiota bacterium]
MRLRLCFIPLLAVRSCSNRGQFLLGFGLALCFCILGFINASAEEPKSAPISDRKLPPYTIISEDTELAAWRKAHVRLQEKVSEDDLKLISEDVKSRAKRFNATRIYFYLPEQEAKSMSWAMTLFDHKYDGKWFQYDPNAKLEIHINGSPIGTMPPKLSVEIVGQWEYYGAAYFFYTLYRSKDGLRMLRTVRNEVASDELVTAKIQGNRVILRPMKANDINEYWIVNEQKNLFLMDAEGIDKTLESAIAIIKPTLKP